MRGAMLALAAIIAPGLVAAATLPPGIYTNEEEVYFGKDAKRAPAPWIGITVAADGRIAFVDLFGTPAPAIAYKALGPSAVPGRINMLLLDGRVTELRLARSVTCWDAAPKFAKMADGSEDWYGARNLKLHDQGGRVSFGGSTCGAPVVVLRMGNVIWPSGPSLVLYVHRPDAPEKAVSYSWADPDAKMIGINLRWMQASCTIDTTTEEKPQ